MIDIIQGNNLDSLKNLPSQSINTCVTSPPYYGLRDYGTGTWIGGNENCPHKRTTKISKDTATGHKGMSEQGHVVGDAIYKSVCPDCGAVREDQQLGLEDSPEEFVNNLVKLFQEIKRVLRDDGTVWLNLGDTYCGTGNKGSHTDPKHKEGRNAQGVAINHKLDGFKSKDLIGIPWRVAFALQQDGWYLRQDIIWHKPNPMPESVRDRCTKSHEYIFLLSKNNKYYYDYEAIKEEATYKGVKRGGSTNRYEQNNFGGDNKKYDTKNKRSVWSVNVKPFKSAHFAVFPMDLIEPCVLAGCPEQVCLECNEPYLREVVTIKTEIPTERTNALSPDFIDGKKVIYQRPKLVPQKEFVDFLRSKSSSEFIRHNTTIPHNTCSHWFRYDNTGFSYPTIEDWEEAKYIFDDDSLEFDRINEGLTFIETSTPPQWRPKVEYSHQDNGFKKQCDCKTDETKGGTVLDPFGGSGTTGIVADNNKRNAVLLELNPDYIEIAEARIDLNQKANAQAEYKENLQAKFDF